MSSMTESNLATTQVYRVYIKASPQAVWDAITQPEWTQRYGYGGSVISDFRPGSPYRAFASDEMRALAALAEDGGYDLVVAGPRPERRLARLLGRSVSHSLLSRCRTSVLAVRAE